MSVYVISDQSVCLFVGEDQSHHIDPTVDQSSPPPSFVGKPHIFSRKRFVVKETFKNDKLYLGLCLPHVFFSPFYNCKKLSYDNKVLPYFTFWDLPGKRFKNFKNQRRLRYCRYCKFYCPVLNLPMLTRLCFRSSKVKRNLRRINLAQWQWGPKGGENKNGDYFSNYSVEIQ